MSEDTIATYNRLTRRVKKADKAVALANHELREAQEALSAFMQTGRTD